MTPRGVIRILYPNVPPYVNAECGVSSAIHKSSHCPNPGLCVELMRAIAKTLNLKIQPVSVEGPSGEFDAGGSLNGSWSGALEYVHNGTVDTICALYQTSRRKRVAFDFSDTVYKTGTRLLLRSIDSFEHFGMWDFYYPFTRSLWMAVLMMMLLHCSLAALFAHFERILGLWTHSEVVWRAVKLQLQQQAHFNSSLISSKLWFLLFTFTQCLLIPALYQMWLLASLLSTPEYVPFGTPDEALAEVARGSYRLTLPTGAGGDHWFEEALEESADHKYRHFREHVRKSDIQRTNSIREALKCTQEGRCIMPVSDDSADFALAADYCDITSVTQSMPVAGLHFVFQKNSSFLEAFNRALAAERPRILNLWHLYVHGLPRRRRHDCHENEYLNAKGEHLMCQCVNPYVGLLVLVGILDGLAIFVFFLERSRLHVRRLLRRSIRASKTWKLPILESSLSSNETT